MVNGAPILLTAAGGVNLTTYAPLLVPLATIVVGWLAYLGVRRGSRVEDSQQRAKNKLDERVQALNEMATINERLEAENTRLRTSRDDEDKRHRATQERCRQQIERLLSELNTLRSIVTGEIAKAAATGAAVDAARHIEQHDQDTAEGAP